MEPLASTKPIQFAVGSNEKEASNNPAIEREYFFPGYLALAPIFGMSMRLSSARRCQMVTARTCLYSEKNVVLHHSVYTSKVVSS
jgi:hypothetical protein